MTKVIGTGGSDKLSISEGVGVNLLTNGGFEDFGVRGENNTFFDYGVAGWYVTGDYNLKLQQGSISGAPTDHTSSSVLELDAYVNLWVHQEIDVTEIASEQDTSLNLSFDYANRYNGDNQSTSPFVVQVINNEGVVLYSKYFSNTQSNETFQSFDVDFSVPKGTDGLVLRFKGQGEVDNHGALVDNVSLSQPNLDSSIVTVDGLEGDDIITGGDNSDVLIGGMGDDRIVGNGGDDIIYGDSSSNTSRELLINSDFEDWGDNEGYKSNLFEDYGVTGWYSRGSRKIELQQGQSEGAPDNSDTNTVLELDGLENTWIQQHVNIEGLSESGNIDLMFSFDYANRFMGSNSSTSPFEIEIIDPVGRILYSKYFSNTQGNIDYETFSTDIVVPQGIDYLTVRFAAQGSSDGYGALIDNVSLKYSPSENTFNDTIFAGEGEDIVYGGAGGDIIYGEAGNDTLKGGAEDDIIYGGDGNDILNGGQGNDTLYGGNGDDTLLGGAGGDALYGGAGNDYLQAGFDDDIIMDGGTGIDRYVGSEGNDTMVFDQEDFSDTNLLLSNGTSYLGSRGFDKILVEDDTQIDFSGNTYGVTSGPKVIAQVEAVVAYGDSDQTVSINANAILAQSDQIQTVTHEEPDDWNGFVAYLGEGDDTFNLEAQNWSYSANTPISAELSAAQVSFLGLNETQVAELDAYVFVRSSGESITIWTDAENILQDGRELFGTM
ncbi:calcium-binding protein [Enterovibrio baiacu]|uniref:calcium-binding protein n=1 Tax=Enterovibrio baiacu TaxID=2491023 RepID=UPI001010BDBF|nr:calcium-binding protein [Enterovibrio baiacu]MBE1275324.1 calcium-binding protein [Enterovibrio baiacu]